VGSGIPVYYAIRFYDARAKVESQRSEWWGPKTDPKKLYGGFGLNQDSNGSDRAGDGAPRMAQVRGQPEKLIHEIPDNVITKHQDDVR
jgi:hypothetical protein